LPGKIYTAEDVRRLTEQGGQLVDVLAPAEFEVDHIPGAVNIPLKQLDAKTTAGLDRTRPVIVYCNDFS
jgi:rhodanese-related sulfurtransferase